MNVLGIDMGTSQMKFGVLDAVGNPVILANQDGELCTASEVYFDASGDIRVGTEARNACFEDSTRHASNSKRSLGTDVVQVELPDGTKYTAKDIAKVLLAAGKNNYETKTGNMLTHVVIGIPASFDQRQRQEVKEAAEAVGLTVLLLLHEPTAAALGNQVLKRGDGLRMIVDLGGGTLDVTLLQVSGNSMEVILTHGDQTCGGADFSSRLEHHLLDQFEAKHAFRPSPDQHPTEFADFRQRVEQLKHALSSRQTATIALAFGGKIATVPVSRDEFAKLCPDLVDKIAATIGHVLKQADLDSSKIKEVLLVGGGCKMPMVADAVERLLGTAPVLSEPIFGAALGCAIAGRMEMDRQGLPVSASTGVLLPPVAYFLNEVTSHAIGVTVLTQDRLREVMSPMVNKGRRVPWDHTMTFQLAEPGQTTARIELLQGEAGADRADCLVLGYCDMTDLPPVPNGPHRINVRFQIDRNGMLTISAVDTVGGKTFEMMVDYKKAGANDPAPTSVPPTSGQAA